MAVGSSVVGVVEGEEEEEEMLRGGEEEEEEEIKGVVSVAAPRERLSVMVVGYSLLAGLLSLWVLSRQGGCYCCLSGGGWLVGWSVRTELGRKGWLCPPEGE